MNNENIHQYLSHLESHSFIYDKSTKKSFISQNKSTENPFHYHELRNDESNQLIRRLIHLRFDTFLSENDLKQLNDNIDFSCRNKPQCMVEKLYTRIATHKGNIIINSNTITDTYTNTGFITIYNISSSVINISAKSPVNFIYSRDIGPMIDPDIIEGNINLLQNHINVNDESLKLIIVWILNSFIDNTPHLLLAINGPSGSAKSTIQSFLKKIVDPRNIDLQDQFSSNKDLLLAALQTHLIDMNNVSNLDASMENKMCTILSGGTSVIRKPYTDNAPEIINFKNPMIINGIRKIVKSDDLLERSIVISLEAIHPSKRKTEEDIFSQFNNDLPKILGGIFRTLGKVLALKESFETSGNLNRMADFHRLGLITEKVLDWKKDSFTKAYNRNIFLAQGNIINNSFVPVVWDLNDMDNSD